jgi:rhamnosyltransferase
MKIGAVFVTYNPDNQFIDNFNSVYSQVDHLIISDNTSSDKSLPILNACIKGHSNVSLIKNADNFGISKALNIACKHASEIGIDRVLLLDQDSFVTNSMVTSLSKKMDKLPLAALVGPKIVPKGIDFKKILYQAKYILPSNGILPKRSKVYDTPLQVLFNITSGSLICLKVMQELGGFDENLFIEGVDNEYGLRANKFGYHIYIDNDAFLLQEYGNIEVKQLFGINFYPTNHSPLRHYYVARNRVYIWRIYYKHFKNYLVWDFISTFKMTISIFLFEKQKMLKLKNFCMGVFDGFRGKYGKY